MAKEIHPWERQEDETPKQFEAFVVYRDMGEERTLAKVGKTLGKSATLIERWSSKNKWSDRIAEWDREQDRILRQQHLKDIKKMRERHAKIAEAGLIKAAQALKKMNPEEFKPGDIPKFLEACSKLERISRGDVGDVVEQRDGGEAFDPVQIYIPDNGRSREDESFDDLEV